MKQPLVLLVMRDGKTYELVPAEGIGGKPDRPIAIFNQDDREIVTDILKQTAEIVANA